MADTTPTQRHPNDVGTFVSTMAISYTEPPAEVVQRIEGALRTVQKGAISKSFLKSLLMIKILAPAGSRDLQIYSLPEAMQLIRQTGAVLVRNYYEQAQ